MRFAMGAACARSPLMLLSCGLGLLTLRATPLAADQPMLRQPPHPNHYVLLIDASGSIVANHQKALAYRRALDEISRRLYGSGFGPSIPAISPAADLLSVFHFGIVEGEATTAYLRLKNHDFLTQFIHTLALRRSGFSRQELEALLFPRRFYRLTILHWARPLALAASAATSRPAVIERTFLIVLQDGLPNEGTVQGELALVERWGDPVSVARAKTRVETMAARYLGASGRGRPPISWAATIGGGTAGAPLFLEAVEVRSREEAAWQDQLATTAPFHGAALRWTREFGSRPAAEVSATVGESMRRLVAEVRSFSGQVTVQGQHLSGSAPWNGAARVVVPATCDGPLPCSRQTVSLVLTGAMTRADPVLGPAEYDYTVRMAIVASLPFRCSLPYYLGVAGVGQLVALALAAAGYAFYYRRFGTHFRVKLPGLILPIRLRWGEVLEHRRELGLYPGEEVLRVDLPSYFTQAVLYRGTRFELAADPPGRARWADLAAVVRLPVHERSLSVLRSPHSSPPAWIDLTVTRGRTSAGLTLGKRTATASTTAPGAQAP